MANHVSHAALPYPVKGARYTVQIPYLDADGDPTDPTTPDTEISKDGAAFADCAEEATTITGSNGVAYITLTGAETDVSMLALAAKVASGPKATLLTLYPRVLPIVFTGTASAGAASTITLATDIPAVADLLIGAIVKTTGGTGGGGAGGANNQARTITDFTTGRVATVVPAWETTPDGTTTYDVLLTEGAALRYADVLLWKTASLATVDTAGYPVVTVKDGTGQGEILTTAGAIDSANATAISGDAVAADNLETMLDGTGGQILSLKQLNVVNAAGSAIVATSSGSNGHGMVLTGNGSGHGLSTTGGATGNGVLTVGGATSGSGIRANGTGASTHGLHLVGGPSGSGLRADGASGGSGFDLRGNGTGEGFKSIGGTSGIGARIQGGGVTGSALQLESFANSVDAVAIFGAAGTANGIGVTINGTGFGFNGSVASLAQGAISPGVLVADSITAAAIATDAITEIQTGLATAAGVAAVEADTNDIQSRIPAALVGGKMDCDATAISGDAVAADNLETMLDGTGGQILSLKQLNVVNAAGSAIVAQSTGSGGHGIHATGHTSGAGMRIDGGSTGPGLHIAATGTAAVALVIHANTVTGIGMRINGAQCADIEAFGTGGAIHFASAGDAVTIQVFNNSPGPAYKAITVAGPISVNADGFAGIPGISLTPGAGSTGLSSTFSDKTGYALASAGLDSIVGETGINLRQAIALILAACAGKLTGAATTEITIKGADNATTRILATVDASGNRSAVTLTPPA